MASFSISMNNNSLISIIITTLILYWLFKIDNCKCTHIEEGKYLKEWFIFTIIFDIIFIIYFIYLSVSGKNNLLLENMDFHNIKNIIIFFGIIVALINLVMIIRLLVFIHKLKEINCNCGLTKLENFIYYWYIVGFSIILVMLLLGLLYFLYLQYL